MTFEDYTEAAALLRKYATAVESKLYIDMKVEQAHQEIGESERLAFLLEQAAARLDTVPPSKS